MYNTIPLAWRVGEQQGGRWKVEQSASRRGKLAPKRTRVKSLWCMVLTSAACLEVSTNWRPLSVVSARVLGYLLQSIEIQYSRIGRPCLPLLRWHIRTLMLVGATLAALVLVLSFTVFFAGRNVLGLPLAQLQNPGLCHAGGDRSGQCISCARARPFLAVKAPQGRCEGPRSFLYQTTWSLTSPTAKRIRGSKKFRSSVKKDFCNTIEGGGDIAHERRQVRF
jgi:hypothetical protein